MSVNYILYVSTAAVRFKQSELVELLKHARSYNEAHELSGMLLFRAETFIQWLEGPGDQVRTVVEKIRRDRRHDGFRILAQGLLPTRAFPDWSMAFKNLTGIREDHLNGYSELLQANRPFCKDSYAARKLVESLNELAHQPVT